MNSLAAERVFLENMEATDFSEHFLERSYGTTYQSYWESMKEDVTRSTDAYSGNHSMSVDLFKIGPAPGRNIGIGRAQYGNTSNFDLSTAVPGTKIYFRWKQKFSDSASWGSGILSKQIYLNYKDRGDFVLFLVKAHSNRWLLTLKTNDPYDFTINEYFSSATVLDGRWHDFELFLDWTGQENGGNCQAGVNELTLNSTNGTGIISFKVDGETAYEKTNACFYTDSVDGPTLSHVVWPSNRSGDSGAASHTVWLDDLEIWDDRPTANNLSDPRPPTLLE
jgi:hypothetical protein